MESGGSVLLGRLQERLTIRRLKGARAVPGMKEDVREGLCTQPKQLPPKYFYDERGSWLFDKICTTPEYYPMRMENQLLARRSNAIIERVQPDCILELGSGTSRKTIHLLDACHRQDCQARYQPLDVCDAILMQAGTRLLHQYPWLKIEAFVGDYGEGLRHLPADKENVRLFVFLGGTIGNFAEHEAMDFLREVRNVMNERDWFLLGADRVKDVDVLNAAYNDAQGYTAAFNLNILKVINRELNAEFTLEDFRHRAWYDRTRTRIEMHLHAKTPQTVPIHDLNMEVAFAQDESIRTEISRKFTIESLTELVQLAGFKIDGHYQPDNEYFSLVLLRPDHNADTGGNLQ